MKKTLCFFLAFIFMLSLCACRQNSQQIIAPANFYYLTEPSNYQAKAITPEVRETAEVSGDLKALLQLYINGPVSEDYINPFPKNITVLSVDVASTTASIQLSNRFTQLSEADMTSACACLTLTVLELTQRHRLTITSVDAFGNIIYTASMTKDHILLSDTD